MKMIQNLFFRSPVPNELSSLLLRAPLPSSDLQERLAWMSLLIDWIRTGGTGTSEQRQVEPLTESVRCRYLIQVLNRNLELKSRVAECLRSIIRDTRALELFMNVGIPSQDGFFAELWEILLVRFLPQPPQHRDLVAVFSETFRFAQDSDWILGLEPEVFQGILDLFKYTDGPDPILPWNTLGRDAKDALYLLGNAVRAKGLSRLIRNRINEPNFRRIPFFDLSERIDAILTARNPIERKHAHEALNSVFDHCVVVIDEVYLNFRNQGANIALVYQLELLKAQVRRCRTLTDLLAYEKSAHFIQDFLGLLVRENVRARKLRKLMKDNLVLLCLMMVETNAETGEHYITRNRAEYQQILKKALGGGALTGFTTLFKFLLTHLSAPPFISGLFSVANYSVSFVSIQLLGFTLATKQPAMTATVIAAKIEETGESVEPLINEVVNLVRSQFATVLGNLLAVIPAVILIDVISYQFGTHLTDPAHAKQIIDSFSIWGMTPFYAAWTGVLLWLSSVFSGWFGNWYNFRGLPDAVEHHTKLRFMLGPKRAKRFSHTLKKHSAGLAANLSLAFLLGMTPFIAAFFGIALEARHVTLSSGVLTAAVMSVDGSIYAQSAFWLAMAGIVSMGVLNLSVSFFLALNVAIWAKKVSSPRRDVIYRALLAKLLREPWVFLFPAKKVARPPNRKTTPH